MSPLPIGTEVLYRRGWTTDRTYTARIKRVELTDSVEIVYVLDDGHWCYHGQIIGAVDWYG